MLARWSTLALVLTAACTRGEERISGISGPLDASPADAACVDLDASHTAPCTSNEECLAFFARIAPSGELFATCFEGGCRAAEHCIETNAGVPNYCTCGRSLRYLGCFPSGLCVRTAGAAEPDCVAACVH